MAIISHLVGWANAFAIASQDLGLYALELSCDNADLNFGM
jgi:hypothetical protein